MMGMPGKLKINGVLTDYFEVNWPVIQEYYWIIIIDIPEECFQPLPVALPAVISSHQIKGGIYQKKGVLEYFDPGLVKKSWASILPVVFMISVNPVKSIFWTELTE